MMDYTAEILSAIKEVCPTGTPKIDDFNKPLMEYGLDSLDLSALFLSLEERFNVKVSDDDFDKLNTVNSIDAFLKQNAS